MSVAIDQIPRLSLVGLLLAHVVVVLPYVGRVPHWLLAIVALCIFWRVMVFNELWRFPNTFWKTFLLIIGIIVIWLGDDQKIGLPISINLLILAFSFKLLEMQHERDAYVIVLLGYFIIAAQFLYRTDLFSFFYAFFCVLMLTGVLVSLSQGGVKKPKRRAWKVAVLMLLQSLPLMIVLFVFFPRIAPFLTLQAPTETARSGIADSMTPGDVSELSLSNALAFRAQFDDKIPNIQQLYWRSIVLSQFDGRTWSMDTNLIGQTGVLWQSEPVLNQILSNPKNTPLYYSIILEPTQNHYLVGLDLSFPKTPHIGITRSFHLVTQNTIDSAFKYQLVSFLNYRLDLQLDAWMQDRYLQLPQQGNEKSRALAQQWMQSVNGDVYQYIQHILHWFKTSGFVYTLQPDQLSNNVIDGFLFDKKAGFCAHYASALTYLLRAAHIPARMVVGYQGGELNPLGRYILVHQYDAHAWVEAWLGAQQGWVRIDPTSSVMPERITRGAEEVLSSQQAMANTGLLNIRRYWHQPMVKSIRLSLDYINYAWTRHVVKYDRVHQANFLTQRLHLAHLYDQVLWMMGLLGVITLLIASYLFRRQPSVKKDILDQAYLYFCQRMHRLDVTRFVGETPEQFCQRIRLLCPDHYMTAVRITRWYQKHQYQAVDLHHRRMAAEKIRQLAQKIASKKQ